MIFTTSEINHLNNLTIISRLGFLLLSVLSNLLILDHSSDGFTAPALLAFDQFSTIDKILWILLGGLLKWDAQHFLHIAHSGYTYENNLPFFPLFPVIIKNVAYFLQYIFGFHITTSLLLTSFILNTIFFMKASTTLYTLSFNIFKNQMFAYYSVLFFCISPATIFFIAPYSESLFSYCVFKGMLKYVQNKYWYSLLWFSISVLTRANGIVNIGFILHLFYYYIWLTKFRNLKTVFKYMFYSFFSILGILLPFAAFQLYTYLQFCIVKHNYSPIIFDYAKQNHLLLAGTGSVWCNSTIPFSYQYVQEHYWKVGFLKYYTIKQIPNFILALPIIILIFKYCGRYFLENWKLLFQPDQIYKYDDTSLNQLSNSQFVFIVHVIYLTIFALININIQVITRFIASSSPLIYWIAAQEFIVQKDMHDKYLEEFSFSKWISYFHTNRISGQIIKLYFLTYAVLGVVLFSNNFPWT